ncbi:MAG TPA: RDD family protein [Acidobacteriota bacterium]|jgi:uncharacterized RDD family membrane protein YckC
MCPNCSSTSFVHGHPCDHCGYQDPGVKSAPKSGEARAKRAAAKDPANLSFDFAPDGSAVSSPEGWREELRKKLAHVQEKKGGSAVAPAARTLKPASAPQQPQPVKAPEIRRTFVDPQPIKKADYDIHRNLRDFQASIQKLPPTQGPSKARVVPAPAQRELPRATPPEARPAPVAVRAEPLISEPEWLIDKGILMTRTLSGLIDLCFVFVCFALFVLVSLRWGAVDVLARSFRPVLWGAAVFFQAFYSIYFLGLTHRTVGMMITGLRVADEQLGRPEFRQILLRTLFFFFSWGLALFGLLWGFWDRRSRCLHDFLSHTVVVRC